MKEQLTWKTFFLLQPILLFYAYLVGCFFDAITRTLPYGPKDFPINTAMLIFVVPSALFAGLITHLLIRNYLSPDRETISLAFLVPAASGVIVQVIFRLIAWIVKIEPAG